ncbi:MAG: NAD(P)-dependent oxidoreductase [Aliarcobacter sp.]|nr:NAD(P)-dependent oxidoreductase [Aliarcobacter sp.]
MVIGTGQLAKCFQDYLNNDEVCIFASGVSNSNCEDSSQFNREKNLLLNTLNDNKEKSFIYFSSCALSVESYPKNAYYKHKKNMEDIIKEHSTNYYIFRIPQLFGDLIIHKTLINFIYKSIMHNHKFNVYDNAYRYVIEIIDVKKLVDTYLKNHSSCVCVNLANNYKYKVLDIVNIFETLLEKKANYQLLEKTDDYTLNLSSLEEFIIKNKININFGEEYLMTKLKEKLK